jgi:plasmid stability protein
MIRTLVQLDEHTYRRLRQRAFEEERSMSAVVREMLAQGLGDRTAPDRSHRSRRFLSVQAGRCGRPRAGLGAA